MQTRAILIGLLVGGVLHVRAEPPALHSPDTAVSTAPAELRRHRDGGPTGVELSESQVCGGCHPVAFAQWQGSAHAYASFDNPIYRASVENFRKATGVRASRMCAGCHDPALLIDGAMDREVHPADPRARAGVGCLACHAARSAELQGNGSLTLSGGGHLPRDLGEQELAQHRASMDVTPLGARLCAGCHRSFLGAETGHPDHLTGMDEYGAWLESGYAGPSLLQLEPARELRQCRDCHMPVQPAPRDLAAPAGSMRSHRFTGGHTWLSTMLSDAEGLSAARAQLRKAVSVEVVPVEWEGRVAYDVVLHNRGAGHRFPAGVRDAQQTWLEVRVLRSDGTTALSHGTDAARAHLLAAWVVDDGGRIRRAREVQLFRASVGDHTLPARGSRVARYVPEQALPPHAQLQVRLLHRSRTPELAEAACAAHLDVRGRRFAQASAASEKPLLAACQPPPVTELARVEVVLDDLSAASAVLARHGLSLVAHEVQQHLSPATGSLERALALASNASERAQAHYGLGLLAGRLGRTWEARRHFEAARREIGPRPALDHAEAQVLDRAWRHGAALSFHEAASLAAPQSVLGWTRLAAAYASLGRSRRSMQAVLSGLALSPNDPELLRLRALASGREEHWRSYTRRKPPVTDRFRTACATRQPECEFRLAPVPRYPLTADTGEWSTKPSGER